MTAVLPLLIELGTEELPPKALDELALAFRDGVTGGFEKRGVAFEAGSVSAYWRARRLALLIGAIEAQHPDQDTERRGRALSAGFDAQGKPSKALIGFAQSCGVDVAALVKLETDKGAGFVHRGIRRGVPTAKLVPGIVAEALKALPIPKPMRWGDHDYLFVRPAQWLVMLLGDKVIEGVVLGLTADRFSRGHRFHHAKPVWISTPEAYVEALRAAKVLVDPDERRRAVAETVERAADNDTGGRARLRDALLDEVKNLVEWPAGIACTFEREYLRVPPEALVTTMESNQKFFPVFDPAIYLQSGHDIDYLEARSHGRFRIFSKLGNGTEGQMTDVGYACLPVLDPDEQPVLGWGRELVIAAHLPTGGATWKERDRLLATYYRAILERVIDGRL